MAWLVDRRIVNHGETPPVGFTEITDKVLPDVLCAKRGYEWAVANEGAVWFFLYTMANIVGRGPLKECRRVFTGDFELTHVGKIKQTDIISHCQMLGSHTGVLNRHQVTGKLDYFGLGFNMEAVKGRF